jgi:uncharacterized protein YodC (DUF2158 family)
MAQFKVGDVVRLKSGGPPMTVAIPGEDIYCHWFLGSQQQHGSFPPEALELVEENEAKSRGA